MSTQTIVRNPSYVSTPNKKPSNVSSNGTHILENTPEDTDQTQIINQSKKSIIFEGPGEKLGKEFDDAATDDDAATADDAAAKDEYLKRKIKNVEEYLDDRKKRYKAEQDDRVEETAKMNFGLYAKKGGRRSKKAQRKHRKKTSKRKSRK